MSHPHESRGNPPAHPHRLSNALLMIVTVGAAATIATIVLSSGGAAGTVPWKTLTLVFAVPTALAAAYFCLARGHEDS